MSEEEDPPLGSGRNQAEKQIFELDASGLSERARQLISGALAICAMTGTAQGLQGILADVCKDEQQAAARLFGKLLGDALAMALEQGWPTGSAEPAPSESSS